MSEITVIIIAGGGKLERVNLQKMGRGLRRKSTRNLVFVVDIQDEQLYLKGQSKDRAKIWHSQDGFNHHIVNSIEDVVSVIQNESDKIANDQAQLVW
jgi:superfamily II DNA or RNA helicase